MLGLMPPTAIEHWVDGRWGFKTYIDRPAIREAYWSGDIVFDVDCRGRLQEIPYVPHHYGPGGSQELERAIYLGIPLVHVRFV